MDDQCHPYCFIQPQTHQESNNLEISTLNLRIQGSQALGLLNDDLKCLFPQHIS